MSVREETHVVMERVFHQADGSSLSIIMRSDGEVTVYPRVHNDGYVLSKDQWSRLNGDMASIRYMLDREAREQENARKLAQEEEQNTQFSHIDDVAPIVTE